MNVPEILYKLILGPIELLFDVVFAVSMQVTKSPVLSIIVLSLVMNFLLLPLYKRADAIQDAERTLDVEKMSPRGVIEAVRRLGEPFAS